MAFATGVLRGAFDARKYYATNKQGENGVHCDRWIFSHDECTKRFIEDILAGLIPNIRSDQPIVAIDARLIGGTSTGDSTYWTGLLSGLRELPQQFHYLLISNGSAPQNIPIGENFSWIHVAVKNPRIWSLVSFPRLARKLGAKIIHTQYSLSPLVRSGGVTTIHDVSFFIGPDWFPSRDRLLLQKSIPASAKRAKAIVTVSETSRQEIERFIPAARGKTHVTYNACPNWIQPMPKEQATAIVQEKGLEVPYILTVSTRWPRKNMELAIQAVEGLPAEIPHPLYLTGKAGWGNQSVPERCKALGYVEQEFLSALYSAADMYLCPSKHEGFGLPLLEAFRCGCPVLCSSGGALPEVAGDAAFVEKSWESADWTKVLGSLLNDSGKLQSMREKGYRRESEFSWKKTAQQTEAVYREVLDAQ